MTSANLTSTAASELSSPASELTPPTDDKWGRVGPARRSRPRSRRLPESRLVLGFPHGPDRRGSFMLTPHLRRCSRTVSLVNCACQLQDPIRVGLHSPVPDRGSRMCLGPNDRRPTSNSQPSRPLWLLNYQLCYSQPTRANCYELHESCELSSKKAGTRLQSLPLERAEPVQPDVSDRKSACSRCRCLRNIAQRLPWPISVAKSGASLGHSPYYGDTAGVQVASGCVARHPA